MFRIMKIEIWTLNTGFSGHVKLHPKVSSRLEIRLTSRRARKNHLFPSTWLSTYWFTKKRFWSTGKSVRNTTYLSILTSLWQPDVEQKRRGKSSPWYYYHVARRPVNVFCNSGSSKGMDYNLVGKYWDGAFNLTARWNANFCVIFFARYSQRLPR